MDGFQKEIIHHSCPFPIPIPRAREREGSTCPRSSPLPLSVDSPPAFLVFKFSSAPATTPRCRPCHCSGEGHDPRAATTRPTEHRRQQIAKVTTDPRATASGCPNENSSRTCLAGAEHKPRRVPRPRPKNRSPHSRPHPKYSGDMPTPTAPLLVLHRREGRRLGRHRSVGDLELTSQLPLIKPLYVRFFPLPYLSCQSVSPSPSRSLPRSAAT